MSDEDEDCDACGGSDLTEIMASIDAQVVDGMRMAFRAEVTRRFSDFESDAEVDEILEGLSGDLSVLVADMRKRVAEVEDMVGVVYPLAEMWRGWVEDRHKRPYEFTSSVVKRGNIQILLSSDSSNSHPQRFARGMDRSKWKMKDGSEIPWDALDPDPNADDADEVGWDVWDTWDRVLDWAVGDDNGTKYRLYSTENADILMIPDGMVYVGEGSDENPDEVDDPDAYFSWPKHTIAKVDDPKKLGLEIGTIMIGDAGPIDDATIPIFESPYWNTLLIYIYPPNRPGRDPWSMTWKWAS